MIWTSIVRSSPVPGEGAITSRRRSDHAIPSELVNSEAIELDAQPSSELQTETSAAETATQAEDDNLRCRSEGQADESPGSWALVILLLLAALGALLGHSLILSARDAAQFTPASRSALELWAGLIGVLCGYGLVAFVVMTRWLWQVLRISRPQISLRSAVRELLPVFRERAARRGAVRGLLAVFLTIFTVLMVTATIPLVA